MEYQIIQIQIPKKILTAFQQAKRFIVIYGGRGSAKSHSVARVLIKEAYENPIRILCCREIQNSIADSVHSILRDIISQYKEFEEFFKVTDKEIIGKNGSQFIFKGLRKEGIGSIKSIEGIDICWVEEAQYISKFSLDILIPTIRKENSRIIFTLNPTNDDDPVYTDFVLTNRPDVTKCEINYNDNPFFPEVLRQEMEWDRQTNIDKYYHVWEGQTVKHSDSQVFKGKWVIDDFETPEGVTFYHGADWGFADDPTCLIRSFIKDNDLYIDQEAYGHRVELDDIAALFDGLNTARKWNIFADNSRPETISYMSRQGFKIKPCEKWQGSVEDGITFLQKFKRIIIHTRCKNTQYEFRNYQYKTDKLTGKILPVLIDKHNHCIDALRYGYNDFIRNNVKVIQLSGISASRIGL